MDYLLQAVGDIRISDVIILIAAVIFVIKIVKSLRKFLNDQAEQIAQQSADYKYIHSSISQYADQFKQSTIRQDNIQKSIDIIEQQLVDTKADVAEMRISAARKTATGNRYRIIRFNDEILKGDLHTKEHFDQILESIDDYENYCIQDGGYQNNKARMAIDNIKHVYQECMNNHSFL